MVIFVEKMIWNFSKNG